MKLLFWRKDPEPAPEPTPPWAGLTNLADMVEMMIGMEWPATDIVWTLRCVEMGRRIAEMGQRIADLETALANSKSGVTHGTPVSERTHKPRVTRPPQVVTRNHVRNQSTKSKRSRAKYMRTYRANQAKLKLVTRDGDAA